MGGGIAAWTDTSAQPLPVSHVEACVASANEKDQLDYALPGQPSQCVDQARYCGLSGGARPYRAAGSSMRCTSFTDSAQKVVDLLRWDCDRRFGFQ